MTSDLLSTAQAAELLGVRTATIYSYVSRGVLTRAGSASRHDGSLFRRADVIALRDNRIRRRSGIFEVSIDTAITRIDPAGRLFYRGHDVTELARDSTFERTAEILWETTELDWSPNAASTRAARIARESAARSSPAARARLAVATLAAAETPSDDLPSAGVAAVNAAVDATAAATAPATAPVDEADGAGPASTRLAHTLGARSPAERHLVGAAMVLLADHELATSTVAARVAASTGAGVFDVVTAGLSAMPGPRHGQVSREVVRYLQRCADDGPRAATAVWDGRLPGFGHIVYAAPDPRATALLDLLDELAPDTVDLADAVIVEALRATGQHPNIDLALGALEVGLRLAPGSGEAIFTIARIAGFVAHMAEELGQPLRFRARAEYVGPE